MAVIVARKIRRLIINLHESLRTALEIPFVGEAPPARHITPWDTNGRGFPGCAWIAAKTLEKF
jgi:hypothetical protein